MAIYARKTFRTSTIEKRNFKKNIYMDILKLFFLVIAEEIVFRDYLILKLHNYENVEIISGTLFGLVHISNIYYQCFFPKIIDKIVYVLFTIPTLIYLGYICALQHNLFHAIIVHLIYNAIAGLIAYVVLNTNSESENKIDGKFPNYDTEGRRYIKKRHSINLCTNKNRKVIDSDFSRYMIKIHKDVEPLWKHEFDKYGYFFNFHAEKDYILV
jgi:hypothetical protein